MDPLSVKISNVGSFVRKWLLETVEASDRFMTLMSSGFASSVYRKSSVPTLALCCSYLLFCHLGVLDHVFSLLDENTEQLTSEQALLWNDWLLCMELVSGEHDRGGVGWAIHDAPL